MINDRMRIKFKENKNVIRKIISLPNSYKELEKICCENFDFENMEGKYLFLKCYGKPEICLVENNYSEIIQKKDNNDDIFYEIEIKKNNPNNTSPNNKYEYRLEKKEKENKITKLIKEKKSEKFIFTLVNKGNHTWKPPFKVTHEKVTGDNLDLLTCSSQIVYHPVEPNQEIQVCVTIIEIDKKNKNASLRIKIQNASNSSSNKYPDNYVEFQFEILSAEDYYQNNK